MRGAFYLNSRGITRNFHQLLDSGGLLRTFALVTQGGSWKSRLGKGRIAGQFAGAGTMRSLIDPPRSLPKLARLVLALAIAAVLFCGLFPFDFDFRRLHPFDWSISQFFTSGDSIENILFFMPLGFALAAMVPQLAKRIHIRTGRATFIVTALISGAIFTCVIESLQCSLSERDPSLTDLINNTIGAGAGAFVYTLIGKPIMWTIAGWIDREQRRGGVALLSIATLVYALVLAGVPVLVGMNAASLSMWKPGFLLALGNEIGENRSWKGQVWDIAIASRAATDAQAADLLLGKSSPREIFGSSLQALYDVRGEPPFVDRTGHLPPLDLSSRPYSTASTADTRPAATTRTLIPDLPPAPPDARPWDINPDQWLRTGAVVTPLSDAIARSSEFTVAFTVASAGQDQYMASRILTISRGANDRNLTFAQDGLDLIVRVRCGATGANADSPEFVVHDVFADARPHRIVATFVQTRLNVFVDSPGWHESVHITPGAAVIWWLYPRNYWKFQTSTNGIAMVSLAYRAMAFLPLGALLAATANQARKSYLERALIATGAAVAITILCEGLIGGVGEQHLSIEKFAASLVFAGIGILIVGIRRSLPFAV